MPRRTKQVTAGEKLIGDRIRQLRHRLGMSQVDLATRLTISQALLSRYEHGSLRIHGVLVAAIAKALGVSSDELLGLKEPRTATAPPDKPFLRRLQQIDTLSTHKKKALLTTIDAVLRGERSA